MSARTNLLMTPDLRQQRKADKRMKLMRFLRQHLWSTQDILQEVLQLASRQAAHKTLTQLESESLVKRHKFEALGGAVTLWGITAHGQAMAFDPITESLYAAYFEPSRVSEQNIRHQLDLQKLQLEAERHGWTNWTDGSRLGDIPKNGKRPDAIATDPQGHRSAIECERTIKTQKRYEQILLAYLRAIKAGKVDNVIWVSPTLEISQRLRAIITGIKSVNIAGQRVAIEPDKHHTYLAFTDYARWPIDVIDDRNFLLLVSE